MTKKDYILISNVLKELKSIEQMYGKITHELVVNKLANTLKSTNERFGMTRFLEASGLNK